MFTEFLLPFAYKLHLHFQHKNIFTKWTKHNAYESHIQLLQYAPTNYSCQLSNTGHQSGCFINNSQHQSALITL